MALLSGGELFMRDMDPDGVLRNATVTSLTYTASGKTDSWSLTASFPSENELRFAGISSVDDTVIITAASYHLKSGQKYNLSVMKSETVSEAFGNLSLLPAQLKKDLGTAGVPFPTEEDVRGRKLFLIAREALFSNIEGGEADGPYRRRFNTITFRYDNIYKNQANTVNIRSSIRFNHGNIMVTANADIYGINEKRVKVLYQTGPTNHVIMDCFSTGSERVCPSIRLAMEMPSMMERFQQKDVTALASDKDTEPTRAIQAPETTQTKEETPPESDAPRRQNKQ